MRYIIKKFFVIVILFFSDQQRIQAQEIEEKNDIIYSQKVERRGNILEIWNAFRGTLYLRENSIEFIPKNPEGRGAFELSYEDVLSVKRRPSIFVPNRIFIKDKNHSTFKIFTYKRKQIVETIQSKIDD